MTLIQSMKRAITALALALAVGACGTPEAAAPERLCLARPAELDRVAAEIVACTSDADCPCGTRCAAGVACTFDCRDDDEPFARPEGMVCTERGACAEE